MRTGAALAAVVLLAPPVLAQRWQADLGATRVAYDTTPWLGAASFAPQAEWYRGELYALASANVAAFEGGTWMAQGWGDFSLLGSPAGAASPLRVEGAASLGGSLHSDGYRTGSTRGELRAHWARRSAGWWVGGVAASGWTTSSADIATMVGPTIGAWLHHRPLTATLIWTPARYDRYWFHEMTARASVAYGPVDLLAYGGWRGPVGGLEDDTWGGATVAVWVAPRAAVVLGLGSYAADFLQALPRGRYVSAAIRIAASRPSVWAPSWTGRTVYTSERNGAELTFRVPGATRVAIVGDWTGWQPVPLERAAGGRWVLRVRLAPGVYRFNLVVDGERWIVPDGAVAMDDGFGGKTGLLVVP